MTLRCAIVDDEPLALGLLQSYVQKTPMLRIMWSLFQCNPSNESTPRQTP